MTEPFNDDEKMMIAGIMATKTPRRHKVITSAYYIFWFLFIFQMLLRSFLHIEHELLSELTVVLFLICMYKREVSNREQLVRKFVLGAQVNEGELTLLQKIRGSESRHWLEVSLITLTFFILLLWILFSH